MTIYTDRNGVERHIDIDPAAIERCRARLGVDLYDLGQLGKAAGDMMKFLRVIHCVVAPGADFGEWWAAHTGDAGDRCVEAFMEALCGFFPTRLATLVRDMNKAVARAVEDAWKQLESEHAATFGPSPVATPAT